MSFFSRIAFRVKALFSKQNLNEQLSEEIRTHVEFATEANVKAGMTPEEARYAALREFGNTIQFQERARDERGWAWLEQLEQDLRFAMRQLVKTPSFTGYVSPDGSAWTAISSQVIVMPKQLYVGIAAASHASVQTVASFENVQVSVATTPPPPAEWAQQNLGSGSGGFTVSDGLTVNAAGGDIYDATDSGVFVYRSWTGGGEFVTRVDSLAKSNDWTKAGIMLRATLAADSANVMVALTPDLGAVLQVRSASGGPSNTDTHDWNPGVPSWIKLRRQNGQIFASWSVDGATWHGVGGVSDTLPDTLFVGFAVSSHEATASTTATFSNFTFQ